MKRDSDKNDTVKSKIKERCNIPGSAYIGFGRLPTTAELKQFDNAFVLWEAKHNILKIKTTTAAA